MLKEKNTLFTIGQFAALHEINKKTLMWYDEIGLLKPACIKENGYRYYSYQQSTVLETILMLRELNVSLDKIKNFMKSRTIDTFDTLLQEKIAELNQTISHLKSIQKILVNQQQDMDMLRSLDLAEISLIEKQSRYLVAVNTTDNLPFEQEIERVISETKKYQLRRLHDASYGSMLPEENSASIVPYILKCLFLFLKRDFTYSQQEHIFRHFIKEAGINCLTGIKKSLLLRISKDCLCMAMLMKWVSTKL